MSSSNFSTNETTIVKLIKRISSAEFRGHMSTLNSHLNPLASCNTGFINKILGDELELEYISPYPKHAKTTYSYESGIEIDGVIDFFNDLQSKTIVKDYSNDTGECCMFFSYFNKEDIINIYNSHTNTKHGSSILSLGLDVKRISSPIDIYYTLPTIISSFDKSFASSASLAGVRYISEATPPSLIKKMAGGSRFVMLIGGDVDVSGDFTPPVWIDMDTVSWARIVNKKNPSSQCFVIMKDIMSAADGHTRHSTSKSCTDESLKLSTMVTAKQFSFFLGKSERERALSISNAINLNLISMAKDMKQDPFTRASERTVSFASASTERMRADNEDIKLYRQSNISPKGGILNVTSLTFFARCYTADSYKKAKIKEAAKESVTLSTSPSSEMFDSIVSRMCAQSIGNIFTSTHRLTSKNAGDSIYSWYKSYLSSACSPSDIRRMKSILPKSMMAEVSKIIISFEDRSTGLTYPGYAIKNCPSFVYDFQEKGRVEVENSINALMFIFRLSFSPTEVFFKNDVVFDKDLKPLKKDRLDRHIHKLLIMADIVSATYGTSSENFMEFLRLSSGMYDNKNKLSSVPGIKPIGKGSYTYDIKKGVSITGSYGTSKGLALSMSSKASRDIVTMIMFLSCSILSAKERTFSQSHFVADEIAYRSNVIIYKKIKSSMAKLESLSTTFGRLIIASFLIFLREK